MICIHYESVLLITSSDGDKPAQVVMDTTWPWQVIEVPTVGAALRQVKHRQPRVVVVDMADMSYASESSRRSLDMISRIRSSAPMVAVVVLGSSDQPNLEVEVRRRGGNVYLPIHREEGRGYVHRVIQTFQSRAGPIVAHGPPESPQQDGTDTS